MSVVDHASFYPPNDLAFSWNYERAREVLSSDFENAPAGVTFSIELYQCFLLIEAGVRFVDEDDASWRAAQVAAKRAKGMAYRLIKEAISGDSLTKVLDEAEKIHDYGSRVWELIGACKAFQEINHEEFLEAVKHNPIRIRRACSVLWPSKAFDKELRDSLVAHPDVATMILVEKYSSAPIPKHVPFLPGSFGNEDANVCMKEYLGSDDVNLNYVNAIVSWPSDCRIKLDKNTSVLAKRVQRELNEELFSNGSGLRVALEVAFD